MGLEVCIGTIIVPIIVVVLVLVLLFKWWEKDYDARMRTTKAYDPDDHKTPKGWEGWDDPNIEGYLEMEREAKHPDRYE